ncbi:MAG: polysaccharide biosynthesis/export family protein [Phycisphaerales bacterium]|nr:MAG: polysaccharide biosynthesis/export family protein [Phycisphaerales bacterium]
MRRMTAEVRCRSLYWLFAALLALCLGLFSGCGNKFWDPTQVGRFRPVPAVNVILDSLGVAEETPVAWEGAEEPLPIDTVPSAADYALRPGDTVTIQIFELLREGVPHVNNYLITETGKISIPEVGVVRAEGLTEAQLEEHIKSILAPNILKQPSVTVTLINSQQRAFSIWGDGVRFPNRYPLPRYDFRLIDALARAGGASQFNVSYIYVSRSLGVPGVEPDLIDPGFGELELDVIEPQSSAPQKSRSFAPRAQYQWPRSKVVVASSEMINGTDSAAPPKGSWQFDQATGSWIYAPDAGGLSGSPPARGEDKPVSVNDLLRTLDERSAGDAANPRRSADEPSPSDRTAGRSDDRINDRTKLRDAMTAPVTSTLSTGTTQEPDRNAVDDIDWVFRDGKWVPVLRKESPGPREKPKPTEEEPAEHIEWVFRNGKWVPVRVGPPRPTVPEIKVEPQVPPVVAERVEAATRLIRIPSEKLFAGDPRYNIVIKPGDSVFVPVDIVGECSIMGNVNRAGFINITGRPITLKQAIAAAGGLGPLAWPKRCEIVRRIGREKEEIVMVDLDKIASGEQPDFFIKPHDLINVGTHATARWRAVLRNAFRATYGFGFVYDRNFANKDFYGQTFNPITPWKWDKVF